MKQAAFDYLRVRDRYQCIPKTELHRHLSGSVRWSTLWTLIQRERAHLESFESPQIKALLNIKGEVGLEQFMATPRPVSSLSAFITPRSGLRPWHIMSTLMRSRSTAELVAYEAVEDAYHEGIRYVEFRVSPHGALGDGPLALSDFLQGLQAGLTRGFQDYGTVGKVILSIIRHTASKLKPRERDVYYGNALSMAERFRGEPVVGFDLAGTEDVGETEHFAEFFDQVKQCQFPITIHAGENQPPGRIREAVERLHADRIGHAVSLINDDRLLDEVRERGIIIEQCITSNFITGVVPRYELHPLPALLRKGVKVVICADDPAVLAISLTDEYERASTELGLGEDQLLIMNDWAFAARFTSSVAASAMR